MSILFTCVLAEIQIKQVIRRATRYGIYRAVYKTFCSVMRHYVLYRRFYKIPTIFFICENARPYIDFSLSYFLDLFYLFQFFCIYFFIFPFWKHCFWFFFPPYCFSVILFLFKRSEINYLNWSFHIDSVFVKKK